MKLNLRRTESIIEGLNTTSGKPCEFHGTKIIYDTTNEAIKQGEWKFAEWKKCEIKDGKWRKGKFYITSSSSKTYTGDSIYTNFVLWLHIKKKNIMAWIGDILSLILTIKKYFL